MGGIMVKSKTREYKSWLAMIQRCERKKDKCYHLYGKRGINVCSVWRGSFDQFLADMGARPSGMTLDRIDNNKGYDKGNCRWATNKQQANNRRNNVLLTLNGKTQTISEWADDVNIKDMTIRGRKAKGWSDEDALTVKVNDFNVKSKPTVIVEYNGEKIALVNLARNINMKYGTLRRRIFEGWSVYDAVNTPIKKSKRWA